MKYLKTTIVLLAFLPVIWLVFVFLPSSTVSYGPLTNIDGIPFPNDHNKILVIEKLAHTDLYLTRSRLAQRLDLTLTFSPGNLTNLDVGIRRDPFWLSYNKINLCCSATDLTQPQTEIHKTISIPITDKLADTDGSLDLMFFATNPTSLTTEDEGIYDRTTWYLHSMEISNHPAWPTQSDLRDYFRSKLLREKAL